MFLNDKISNLKRLKILLYNDWINKRREYNHLKSLYKEIKENNYLDKSIVFNTVRNFKHVYDRELFLGKLFALNGANVKILLDEGVLKHWDTLQIDNFINSKKEFCKLKFNPQLLNTESIFEFLRHIIKKRIQKKARSVYSHRKLEYLYYSKILKNKKLKFEDNIKKFALSSTIRFFKNEILDFKDIRINYYYEISLINSLISKYIGKYIFHELKPDLFITSHGIYSSWGPAFEYLKNKGIKSLVYSGFHGHSNEYKKFFFSDTKIQLLSQSFFWKSYRNRVVTDDMKNKVRDYFEKRMRFSSLDTKLLYPHKLETLNIAKKEGYKFYLVMFPNVIWDGNIQDRHNVFKGLLDWIVSTIEYFKERNDVKLFIKTHPSEITILKNSPKIEDLIRKKINFSKIKNIEIIPPEMQINTYDFIKSGIDLGLCYDNFLALELPYMKIPAIMCVPNGMFAVQKGNIIVHSKKEYFDKLENLDFFINQFHKEIEIYQSNIIRYLYWYLFDLPLKMPTLNKNNPIFTNLINLNKRDLNFSNKLLKFVNFNEINII